MSLKRPFLSICIPTYNRQDILKKTLESIYSDLNGIEIEDFEVIISDNEPNCSSKNIAEMFAFKNLHYFHTTCEGFLNSLYALKYANGHLLKLHNNYTQLKKGSLKLLIDESKNNIETKAIIFYTDGLQLSGKTEHFFTFDDFMYQLSYFSSWSTGFSIWKEDLDKIVDSIEINQYFPQTSLLLAQTKKSTYIINDLSLFHNQNVPKKGGYNIFRVFAVDYIKLIEESFQKKAITKKSFEKIKKELLFNYLSVRYFKTVLLKMDNFEKNNIKKNIEIYYSASAYYFMIFFSLFSPLFFIIIKIRILLFKKKNNYHENSNRRYKRYPK